MPGFSRESRPVRSAMNVFRSTPEEKVMLQAVAKPLGLRGPSEVIRLALDYFFENNPEAKAAARNATPLVPSRRKTR
jgi:hypothetical protein